MTKIYKQNKNLTALFLTLEYFICISEFSALSHYS
jgi:hypothetical protein